MSPMDVISQPVANPIPLVAIAASTAWYLRAAGRVPEWPSRRHLAFLTGQIALLVAFCSGIDANDRDFAAHAIQQVLITLVAPIAFGLSAPVHLLLKSGRPATVQAVQRLQHSAAASPVLAWVVYGASVSLLYFTGLYGDTVRNSFLRGAVLFELFVAGCLVWAPVVSTRLGYWWKMGYLLLMLPYHTIVGMALESQTSSIAPATPLGTLHLGAVIIWVSAQAIALGGAIVVFFQWLAAEEKKAEQHDASNTGAAERQLEHWRATREAAARAVSRID